MKETSSPAPSWEEACRFLALPPEDLLSQCRRDRFQASGPGGQKRNRVYSAVRLFHAGSGLSAEGRERREADRNLRDALRKLRLALALWPPMADPGAVPPPSETAAAFAFRAEVAPAHADFPRALLRALHALAWRRGRLAEAAADLGCSTSALGRLLRADKQGWVRALEIRKREGLPPLQ